MRYPIPVSDLEELLSIPSVSPERPNYRFESPPPNSDPDLTLQDTNSPTHSTPSTPDSQTPLPKRSRTASSDSDPETPSTSTTPATSLVQQTIL